MTRPGRGNCCKWLHLLLAGSLKEYPMFQASRIRNHACNGFWRQKPQILCTWTLWVPVCREVEPQRTGYAEVIARRSIVHGFQGYSKIGGTFRNTQYMTSCTVSETVRRLSEATHAECTFWCFGPLGLWGDPLQRKHPGRASRFR